MKWSSEIKTFVAWINLSSSEVKIIMKFENFSVKRTQCSNTISCHLGHLAALGRIIFVCVANPDCGIWYVASLVNLYFPFLFRCRLYTILIYLNVIFLCLQDCFPVLIEELIWNDLVLCVSSSLLWHGPLHYSQKFDATLKHRVPSYTVTWFWGMMLGPTLVR